MKETYMKIFSLAITIIFVVGLIPALPVKAQGLVEITVDRADLEYPLRGWMKITVNAPEWNTNTTLPDVVNKSVVFKNVSDGSIVSAFLLEFTETGNNTGVFEISRVAYDNQTLEEVKYIELNRANVTSEGYFEVYLFEDTSRISNNVIFEVVAPAPTVEIVEPASLRDELTIRITDPGVNKASWVEDTTEPVIFVYINGTPLPAPISATETGVDTDVFEVTTELYFDILPPLPSPVNITVVYIGAYGDEVSDATWLTWHKSDVITDKTQTSPYATVVLTVYDPDLNDEATAIDYISIRVPPNTDFADINVTFEGGTTIGKLWILDQDGNPINTSSGALLIGLETGADTGYFEIPIDLSKFTVSPNVTALQFVWTDLTWDVAVNYTVTVEVPPVALSADRTEIPLSKEGNMYIHLNIIDAVLLSPNETLSFLTIEVRNYLGNVVYSYPPQNNIIVVDSTSGEDGEWVVTFHIDPDLLIPQLIGGDVHVIYKDKEISIPFTIYDASISVSTQEAKYGDEITVTVNDPDRNFDMDEYDTFSLEGLTFNETAPDSGVFTASFVLDDTWGLPGSTISFSLVDRTSAGTSRYASDFSKSTTSASVKILSFAGELATDKSEYLPVESIVITVNDPDMNIDPEANDTVSVYAKTIGMVEATNITLSEVDENLGIFNRTLTVEELASTLGTTVDDIIGKNILLIYRDPYSPEGLISVTTTIKVVTVDGEVYFDKALYRFDEGAVITVKDPDQAGAGSIDVRVWSDSDPIGTRITLVEVDDGVFQGEVGIVNVYTGLGGQIYTNYGDTIYVAYEDPWSANGQPAIFMATAAVEAVPEFPISVPPEQISFVDVSGVPVTELTAGSPVALQIPVENTGPTEVSFVVFIVVLDEAGVPVYVSFTSGTVAPYSTTTAGPGWTPTKPGTYHVKVLVWKSLTDKTPLMETAVEFDVTVS